jgi:hypothetical protein
MMNRAKSRFLVTTAALLASVSFASAQSMSGESGGAGGASENGMSAGAAEIAPLWQARAYPKQLGEDAIVPLRRDR